MSRITDLHVYLIQALNDSEILAAWFRELEVMARIDRDQAISDLCGKMRDTSEDLDLIEALEDLRDPAFFSGFTRAFHEQGKT